MKDKRIIEIGVCCAGIPQAFSDILDTAHIQFSEHPFGYISKNTTTLNTVKIKTKNRILNLIINYINRVYNFITFLKIIRDYDVLHFHFNTILPLYLDTIPYKFMDKKVILHYHGSDIRHKSYKNKFSVLIDHIFVSTIDLLDHAPSRAVWIPNPINTNLLKQINISNKSIKIIHAPSIRSRKGTDIICQIVNELLAEGYDIEFELVEGMTHKDAIERYKQADIIIDQINYDIGTYGLFSIECMSLGKPVFCHISTKYKNKLPQCPIISFDETDLKMKLIEYIHSEEKRSACGNACRRYAEDVHDINKIINKIQNLI